MAKRTFEALLSRYPDKVRALALTARTFVLTVLPGAEETVDNTAPVAGYGYSAGYSGLVCTLIFSKSGVKLGLNQGAKLKDPERLLRGAGKAHRYIQLESAADLRRAGVKRLLRAADAARADREGRTSRRRTGRS